MWKKAQVEIGAIIVLILLVIFVLPAITDTIKTTSCQNEKAEIENLKNQLSQCQSNLALERQKTQDALSGLGNCQEILSQCNSNLDKCEETYFTLQQECAEKEQPKNIYYFVKVFSDKIVLFDTLVLYNLHLFGLFLSFGITFTVRLFEIDIEIKVLNKKNQKKLVRIIRNYLVQYPWSPILIMLVFILLSNLILWIF